MAKALFGHVGLGPDPRLTAEVHRLRRQVHDLEAELSQLRQINDRLVESVRVSDDMLAISVPDSAAEVAGEPALA
ncbi:MAG TPA: hypothetical protein VNG13_11070 [Mycobacteriales bacterium]|nr:hypothetical protein [Mycobacteriales bacterium]